ncbi:MAG: four helix bundle protein, partial [Patescibacteria group bacterium]
PPPDAIFALPLFQHSYRFLIALHQAVDRFPKRDRHGIGAKLEKDAVEIFAMLLRANSLRGYKRLAMLNECSIQLDLLKVLVRLAKDVGALQEKSYIGLESRLVENGKMLGGWIKSSSTTNRP